ncbi:MAG: FtsX-like permease family protein [Acidobacteria bacterium]|nr:MAG: FtsX-like permease family protein [Acidobacteriota bacterium]
MKCLARACYRLCLLVYPEDFRRQFESSMVATFDELVRSRGTISVLSREVLDVLVQGLRERAARGRRSRPNKTASTAELWLKDLRYAARTLVRSPSFALVVVVSLALGIGANTAIFTLVNAMLLKPMPVKAPEELVAVYAMRPTHRFPSNFSYQNYLDLREEKKIFRDLVGFYGSPVSLHASSEPELVWSELVTENYFEGLGVSAASGRLFESTDVEAPVVVLSYEFWRRRFLGAVDVVGRVVRLNGHAFTVLGVAAPGFTGAKMLGFNPDLWVPLTWHRQIHPGDDGLLERRHGGWLNVRGRLAPGVTLAEAQAALGTIAARLEAAYPEANKDWQLHVYKSPRKTEPFLEVMTGGAIPVAAGALLAIVLIVLLVACANVASLQLARSMGREKEMALRISLGASRRQILRQLLLESLLLCTAAGLLGLWLGGRLLNLALRMNPVLDFSVDFGATTVADARVLGFTLVVSVLAGLVSGLLPAARASRRDVAATLAERGSSGRGAGRRFIVIPQLALSLVALVVAGLLIRSFDNMKAASPGFDTESIALASFNLELQGYDKAEARELGRQLLDRMRGLPEISAASLAFPLPLDAYQESAVVVPMDAALGQEEEELWLSYSAVSEDYFETIGTPLLAGRGFRREDSEERPLVAVVNETMRARCGRKRARSAGNFGSAARATLLKLSA